jgi:predicted Zn-dependent protease
LEVWLAEGDREIAAQNAAAAETTFQKVLAKYPNQARATYGLAIASVMSGHASQAEELFTSLVSGGGGANSSASPVDPSLVAWSYVYLGRIHDLEGDRVVALSNYHAALSVNGAPEAAKVAAQRGADVPYEPQHAHSDDNK